MGTLLKGGTVVEFEPVTVERTDLRIENGKIVTRGLDLVPLDGEEVVELGQKVLIPGLVCSHQHLASAILRDLFNLSSGSPFLQRVEQEWRLERELDLASVELAGAIGAAEALAAGTTTVFDQHSSPSCIQGSLDQLAKGINEVGLRAVLSYEVSDRNGAVGREEAIEENISFQRKANGRVRGMIGAHASFTLSTDALDGLRSAVKETRLGLHIQLAEDPTDEKLSRQHFGDGPVARLLKYELLDSNSIVAHAVHLSWPELSQVISTGAWLVHNARSNMKNQVGYAPAGKFGSRAALGCDRMAPDIFLEAQVAHLRAREAGLEIDALKYVANGHRLATQAFGMPIGPLRDGAAADLVVLNYQAPFSLAPDNLASHLLSRWSARLVDAVMIDGIWRLRAGKILSHDLEVIASRAREITSAICARAQRTA